MFQARQGDIFFEAVKAPPKNAKKRENAILAYGEVTGHCHKIEDAGGVALLEDEEGSIYMKAEDKSYNIVHDEHSALECPPDIWIKVTRQREYDPLAVNRERKVAD